MYLKLDYLDEYIFNVLIVPEMYKLNKSQAKFPFQLYDFNKTNAIMKIKTIFQIPQKV